MVEAEKRLLANALHNLDNQHFILLSDSCVPLHNFDYVYNYLLGTNVSFIDSFWDPGPHGNARYTEHMSPEIEEKDFRKGAQMIDPTGIANWSVTHVDWSEGKWHPKAYQAKEVTYELLKNITSIVENYHVTSDDKKVKMVSPCLWNGMKRPCYLFARKFLPETLDDLMQLLVDLFGPVNGVEDCWGQLECLAILESRVGLWWLLLCVTLCPVVDLLGPVNGVEDCWSQLECFASLESLRVGLWWLLFICYTMPCNWPCFTLPFSILFVIRAIPIRILTVGKRRSPGAQLLVEEYMEKLRYYCSVEDVHVKSNPKSSSNVKAQIDAEDMVIMQQIRHEDWVVVLDEHGLDVRSEQLADLLGDAGRTGSTRLAFCIGGPYGHGPQLRNRADVTIRLSSMVLNHQIALIVLLEQLYSNKKHALQYMGEEKI
ncbi:Core-2/I-Branching enzyme [Musa troglodytarum]|uniref:Core-2/I-Branching enzyme n=1 Tax=Musa troglodytarum TaxID=320322 RepID=A0A9E7EXR7_9LILI|nr:Core-2/I-Branching enzyme [Musa troglodytarum]